MSEFNRAEQIAESQEELMKIRDARLAYLNQNARLLFLHAKARKERKIYTSLKTSLKTTPPEILRRESILLSKSSK